MTKDIITIKCGLFRKIGHSNQPNICVREYKTCKAYKNSPAFTHDLPYCYLIHKTLTENGFNKILYKAGKLKIKVKQRKDIYGCKYYE